MYEYEEFDIELKVYLKNVKKPIILLVQNKSQFDKFYDEIQTHDIVQFGQIIFKREDFLYATLEV